VAFLLPHAEFPADVDGACEFVGDDNGGLCVGLQIAKRVTTLAGGELHYSRSEEDSRFAVFSVILRNNTPQAAA